MVLQTVLVPMININGKPISLKKAINWIRKKGYKEYYFKKGAHIVNNYYRFRQSEPLTQKEKKDGWCYTTDKLKNNVILVWKYQV